MKNTFAAALVCCFLLTPIATRADSFRDALGPKFKAQDLHYHKGGTKKGLDTLHRWNAIAIDASGLDHTPASQGPPHVFGEQLGPGRSSRAMAIVHIAIFDAVNALERKYHSYTDVQVEHRGDFSMDAAIAQAAHDTLVALYPSQTALFDSELTTDLAKIDNKKHKANGIALGQATAAAVLALRVGDGSEVPEPHVGTGPGEYSTINLPGHWQQDPIGLIPLALGAHWGECVPFVITSGSQFRAPAPPSMTSFDYTTAYNEVKSVGGDGMVTPTLRTGEQTFIGTFWAYDGTPSLCAPPRLYNQIVVHIADQTKLHTMELARLLALINTAMADTGIAVWDSKYFYDFWRPITGIRQSDVGAGDGNPQTVGDPAFMPLGAPASNLAGPNFTPPFPAYPSGHAGFGGAIFQTLRRFYGSDNLPFTFVSDEFNGITQDHNGNVRPLMPRSFATLSQAEEENGQSRIYLGIHWRFDKTEGINLGRNVANYVFDHAFTPLHDH